MQLCAIFCNNRISSVDKFLLLSHVQYVTPLDRPISFKFPVSAHWERSAGTDIDSKLLKVKTDVKQHTRFEDTVTYYEFEKYTQVVSIRSALWWFQAWSVPHFLPTCSRHKALSLACSDNTSTFRTNLGHHKSLWHFHFVFACLKCCWVEKCNMTSYVLM